MRGRKRGIPLKSVILSLLACITWKWLQIGTDMLPNITSTGDGLLRIVNVDDLDSPWTLKVRVFSDFLVIFGCKIVNCDEMDGGRPELPANRNYYRLSRVSWALAQISCYCNSESRDQSALHQSWIPGLGESQLWDYLTNLLSNTFFNLRLLDDKIIPLAI